MYVLWLFLCVFYLALLLCVVGIGCLCVLVCVLLYNLCLSVWVSVVWVISLLVWVSYGSCVVWFVLWLALHSSLLVVGRSWFSCSVVYFVVHIGVVVLFTCLL